MKRGWNSIVREVVKFRDARDWKQFHTPKDLAAGIAIEAAELQEHFLWKTDTEIQEYLGIAAKHSSVVEELADVIIYALLLADRLDVDIDGAVKKKLALNARKYPVSKARGNARKYTELSDT